LFPKEQVGINPRMPRRTDAFDYLRTGIKKAGEDIKTSTGI
jgi:hypothetical protein